MHVEHRLPGVLTGVEMQAVRAVIWRHRQCPGPFFFFWVFFSLGGGGLFFFFFLGGFFFFFLSLRPYAPTMRVRPAPKRRRFAVMVREATTSTCTLGLWIECPLERIAPAHLRTPFSLGTSQSMILQNRQSASFIPSTHLGVKDISVCPILPIRAHIHSMKERVVRSHQYSAYRTAQPAQAPRGLQPEARRMLRPSTQDQRAPPRRRTFDLLDR